jgi:hypothetical protein
MSKNVSSADNQQGTQHLLSGCWRQYLLGKNSKGAGPSETIRQIPQINRELATLLGILFTDGSVSPKGVNSWRLYFVNKSKTLIDLFRDCMVRVFNLDINRVRISKTKKEFFKAVVDSKEIGNYLVTTFGNFRTLKFKTGDFPNVKLPVLQLLKSSWLREFLKAAFSCDGGVCFYPAYRKGARGGTKWLIRTVFFTCHHPMLRADYMYLLKTLGIEGRDVPEDGKIKIETEDNIRKFHKLIGFIDGVEISNHSKYWSGYSKQYVLELMISSYNNPSKIYNLPKFHLR